MASHGILDRVAIVGMGAPLFANTGTARWTTCLSRPTASP